MRTRALDVHKVGVDFGGTWLRIRALNRSNNAIRTLRKPAPAATDLPDTLSSLFSAWNSQPVELAVAARGVWTPTEKRRLRQLLAPLAKHVRVYSDVEGAWLSAFGSLSPKDPAIVVIAGTGSIAYGRHPLNGPARAGGLGPLIGDEGSGFWVAKEWLRRRQERIACRGTLAEAVREVAAHTPAVFRAGRAGETTALEILRDGQRHLAQLVLDLRRQWSYRGPMSVAGTGTLLEDPRYRAGFEKELARIAGPCDFVRPDMEAAEAVARYGL